MNRIRARLFALLLLLVVVPAPLGQAQFNPQEKKVYDEIARAQEMNDLREMEKIVRRNRAECEGIYNVLEGQMTYNDSVDGWEEIKQIARLIDDTDGSNVYTVRMNKVMALSLDQRQQRDDARSRFHGLKAALRAALESRDQGAFQEAVTSLEELAQVFGTLDDAENQSYCLSEIAMAFKDNERQLDAVKLFDQIDQILTRAGYQRFKFHGDVQAMRDSLKNQGYDPNAKPGESGPSGNTATSYVGEWSEPVPLRYQVEEKLPWKFTTPSHRSSENTQKWPKDILRTNAPADFTGETDFKPLSQKFQVSRDGVKVFIHQEGEKPQEMKCISNPNLFEVSRTGADIEGNPVRLQYAWLAATGGPNEQMFGLSMNSAPRADQFIIRYHPACYLRGKVLGQEVMFFDDNASGRFGDWHGARDNSSALQPEFTFNDAMLVGRAKTAGPFTEFLESEGKFHRLKLNPDDYSVRTRELDVDTGMVRLQFDGKVDPEIVIIEELREFKGAFFAIEERKPTLVPVGTYRLSYGIIRKGGKAQEQSCLILPGASRSFDVKKGEESVVSLGEPFRFDFKAEQQPDGSVKVIGMTVAVYGKSDELYTRFWDQPPIPEKVSMRVKGGGAAGKPMEMEAAGLDEYNENNLALYQPKDLVLPGDPSVSFELKMERKKHDLLGGPIKSDWK